MNDFRDEHQRPTILVLMRYDDTPIMRDIREAIAKAGDCHGYDVIRADDRDFTGELWANVALCLDACKLVVAVLEDIERRDCDANVMIELGYALGLGHRCLLLVERRLPPLPAVLQHRLTQKFDAFDVADSVGARVDRWLTSDAVPRNNRVPDEGR